MANRYLIKFQRDVVSVARKREAPITQIAMVFGISEVTLHNWMKKVDVEDGVRPGLSEKEATEMRELRRRTACSGKRMRSIGERLLISPKITHQNDLLAGPRTGRGRRPRHGDLPGVGFLAQELLPQVGFTDHDARLGERAPHQCCGRRAPRRPEKVALRWRGSSVALRQFVPCLSMRRSTYCNTISWRSNHYFSREGSSASGLFFYLNLRRISMI